MPELFEMTDPVQNYAWGSRTVLARMQDRPAPTQEPEAELWIGSHPQAPSALAVDGAQRPLDELLLADPERFAPGAAALIGESGELPFLLKILAIEAPLSIQVHPSVEQAAEGWDREESQGIARDAPERSYKDRGAKPETVIALTRLELLTGVRDRAELGLLAESLDQQWLRDALAADGPVLQSVLSLSDDDAAVALAELLAAADQLPPADEVGALLSHLREAHPGDRGILVALCMNHLVLEPGEAMFTPAGQVHAYLRGTAVEIMECSDNVLRAGLTPKHVDVPELLRIVAQEQAPGEPVKAPRGPDGLRRYPLWDPRLSLSAGEAGPGRELELEAGVRTVLCTDGAVSLSVPGAAPIEVRAGHSAWISAADERVTVSGEGEFFAVGISA